MTEPNSTRAPDEELKRRVAAIEEAYEFMLAYAAQGVSGEEESGSTREIRTQLGRFDEALEGLAVLFEQVFQAGGPDAAKPRSLMIEMLRQDAGYAQAAIQLACSQPAISSQLIDNLNALVHLRSLLTDLFFIDELLDFQKTGSETK